MTRCVGNVLNCQYEGPGSIPFRSKHNIVPFRVKNLRPVVEFECNVWVNSNDLNYSHRVVH